jgi:glycolate oxidase
MIPETVIPELKAIIGPDHLLTTPEERWTYAYDATDRAHMPDAVVFPGSAEEISAIVRLANEHRFPVVPRGAGTGRSGGSVPIAGGVVLVLTRLNRILEISKNDLVAVVERRFFCSFQSCTREHTYGLSCAWGKRSSAIK